jgi:hypothetical protein
VVVVPAALLVGAEPVAGFLVEVFADIGLAVELV